MKDACCILFSVRICFKLLTLEGVTVITDSPKLSSLKRKKSHKYWWAEIYIEATIVGMSFMVHHASYSYEDALEPGKWPAQT